MSDQTVSMDYNARRSVFRALIQDFSPFWFTWVMNTGIIGILTHELPYQFSGLHVISTVCFVLALVLFVLFSISFILRFILYRAAAYREVTSEHNELMMCACWPISFMTLTSLTSLICSNAYWGGHAFSIVAYVMWWFLVIWTLVFLFWIFTTLIRNHHAAEQRVSFMIILPAVSVSTAGLTGALVAARSYNLEPSLAIPVMIVSFMLVGIGIIFGLILTTYLFYGLLSEGWLAPAMTASTFMLIGPLGQSAACLLELGSGASTYQIFAHYNRPPFFTTESAMSLDVACTLIALLLAGLGIIWTILATFVMVERAVRKELSWSPGWNSIIFPTGTLCTSFELFSIGLDSSAFRVVTCILLIILIIVYLVNTVFTIPKIAKGELLIVREDPRMRESDKEK